MKYLDLIITSLLVSSTDLREPGILYGPSVLVKWTRLVALMNLIDIISIPCKKVVDNHVHNQNRNVYLK